MSALLAGVGLKDYLYGAAILALIAGFGLYTHHERVIGADEALAPVAVLAHKAEVRVAVATAVAQSTEKDNARAYSQSVSAPAVPALGIVCHDTRSGEVPEAAASSAPRVDRPAADSGSYDPSGSVLTDAARADAQIAYLQGRVHELEAQMEAGP